MTEKRFSTLHSYLGMYTIFDDKEGKPLNSRDVIELLEENEELKQSNQKLNDELQETMGYLALKSGVEKENEQLKKGMIGVVDRYIKNVECNPPSSAQTYGKIKGALINIREDLRNLIGDLE